jgi:hypothetical protein
VKIDLDLAGILRKTFQVSELDLVSTPTLTSQMLDTWLWNVPVPAGEECTNPLCHRLFSIFGPAYTHAQLNAATHDALCEMFGTVYVKPFDQLTKILKKGRAVDSHGRDTYLPHVGNLAELPLTFLSGGHNLILGPEGSAITLEWLRMKQQPSFEQGFYTRHVFPDYAHMDHFIGKHADRDVFPVIARTLANPPGTRPA